MNTKDEQIADAVTCSLIERGFEVQRFWAPTWAIDENKNVVLAGNLDEDQASDFICAKTRRINSGEGMTFADLVDKLELYFLEYGEAKDFRWYIYEVSCRLMVYPCGVEDVNQLVWCVRMDCKDLR